MIIIHKSLCTGLENEHDIPLDWDTQPASNIQSDGVGRHRSTGQVFDSPIT